VKRFYQIIAVATAILAATSAEAGPPVTLREMVEKTISANPQVQAQFHTYQSALEEQGVARGELFPKADIISTYRAQESKVQNIGNTELPEYETQLVIKQLLFDGFATTSEVRRLNHASRVRYYDLLATMQDTTLEFVKAYIDIQRYEQLIDYAKENYVAHKQLFDRIEERVNAGVGRRVDLEQASGRLALAESNLLTEITHLHDVKVRFQRLLGESPPETMEVVDFSKFGVDPTAGEALAVAYKQNPQLHSSIENIFATQQELKTKEAKYMPRLDLLARHDLDVSSNGKNSSEAADVLEVTLSFNLFNGLSDKSAISQINEKLNSTKDLRDNACLEVRQSLVIAYDDIGHFKEQLIYRNQHQLATEKARVAYRKQYDLGQRTLLDLLDTENELFQARLDYANTEMDLNTAYARVYAAQGELLSKLQVMRTDLPDFTKSESLDSEAVCKIDTNMPILVDKAQLLMDAKPLGTMLSGTNVESTNAEITRAESTNTEPAKPVVENTVSQKALAANEIITKQTRDWAAAWERKDVDAYLAFYADSFVPEKSLSKEAWAAQRRSRIEGADKISLVLQDIKVNVNGTKATSEFLQQYQTAKYQDSVTKTLNWELIDNRWMIVQEFSR
jgi:outer membrane protein, adhesin transport system